MAIMQLPMAPGVQQPMGQSMGQPMTQALSPSRSGTFLDWFTIQKKRPARTLAELNETRRNRARQGVGTSALMSASQAIGDTSKSDFEALMGALGGATEAAQKGNLTVEQVEMEELARRQEEEQKAYERAKAEQEMGLKERELAQRLQIAKIQAAGQAAGQDNFAKMLQGLAARTAVEDIERTGKAQNISQQLEAIAPSLTQERGGKFLGVTLPTWLSAKPAASPEAFAATVSSITGQSMSPKTAEDMSAKERQQYLSSLQSVYKGQMQTPQQIQQRAAAIGSGQFGAATPQTGAQAPRQAAQPSAGKYKIVSVG